MTGRRGEFDLIAHHFAPLAAGVEGALGLTDDAALLPVTPGCRLAVTVDALVAGVHFFPDDPPASIARKLMRVNLSDLAAMGAKPLACVLALALPSDLDEAWVAAFAHGLGQDAAEFAMPLVGGDTVGMPGPLTLSLTAMGEVETGRELRRSGAREGDLLYVSGTIGDAALGLALRQGRLRVPAAEDAAWLQDRFLLPRPRVALGRALVGLASAAMDISDGLMADLGHVCRASGVGARLRAGRVPLSGAARRALDREPGLLADILAGGDDYELLFAAPPTAGEEIAAIGRALGLPLTCLGAFVHAGEGVAALGPDEQPLDLPKVGFQHF